MPPARRTRENSQTEFDRVIALIGARCGEYDFDLSAVAVDLSCSPRQAQRILGLHNTSFRAELTDARMERGAREIVSGSSVRRAADLSG